MSDDEHVMAREYRRSAQLCRDTLKSCNPATALIRRVRAWAYDKLAESIERDLSKR